MIIEYLLFNFNVLCIDLVLMHLFIYFLICKYVGTSNARNIAKWFTPRVKRCKVWWSQEFQAYWVYFFYDV